MLDIRFERAAYFGRRDFFCRMVSISYGSRDGWKHAPPSTRCELLVCELAVVFEQTVLLSQFPYLLFEWPTFLYASGASARRVHRDWLPRLRVAHFQSQPATGPPLQQGAGRGAKRWPGDCRQRDNKPPNEPSPPSARTS
jgi:hypothetical protein